MRTRSPNASDAAKIAAVHVAAWQAAYRDLMPSEFLACLSVKDRELMWDRCIADGQPWLLVAEFDDEIVGFVAYGKARTPGEAQDVSEIWALYVNPDHWERSAGRALLAAAIDDLRSRGFQELVLWAIVGNSRADLFYSRVGFIKDVTVRRDFSVADVQLQEDRYHMAIPQNAA
jgi:GNAT superfamily N-acetyltransferase